MKKIFGVEAEINITADEDVSKGIGKGLSKGAISISDLIKEIKPEIVKVLKKWVNEDNKEKKTKNE